MDLRDTYNYIAEDWHKDHQKDIWWQPMTDTFCSLLPTGGSVLDVGCGPGYKTSYLVSKGMNVTGVDFSENFIEIAKREIPQATFFVMDMRDLSSLPGTYDGMYASASLLHISKSDVPGVLEGLVKKLKPEGYLYLLVKLQEEGAPGEKTLLKNKHNKTYEQFFSYFTLEEITRYTTDVGLKIVESKIHEQEGIRWIECLAQL